jgi:hypothetical protein
VSEVTHDDVYGRGNTSETATTNAMASQTGYPARTVDGDLVNIVKKDVSGQGATILRDDTGKEWIARDSDSLLMETNGEGAPADRYTDRPTVAGQNAAQLGKDEQAA